MSVIKVDSFQVLPSRGFRIITYSVMCLSTLHMTLTIPIIPGKLSVPLP